MKSSKAQSAKLPAKLPAPRMVAYIPGTDYIEGRGYRVAFVTEGEDGYRPTGNWPYNGGRGEVVPWFWGPTLAEANKHAEEYNAERGISKMEAFNIIGKSMFGERFGR